ncbi:PilZ domain-containing protein [Propionivibrio sp.]|uniref:PilZ domain-containing protein n=1 Tax=Propionivibrio sp. TaxID=2212460 RepID=UPI003BF05275
MNKIERRRQPRFPNHSKGELRLNLMAYRGALIDISLFGALFETKLFELNFAKGDNCTLEILHLNQDPLISVEGVISHAKDNLIGIQFSTLDREQQDEFQQIGRLNLAPPNFLNRNLPALFQAWQ